MQALSEDWAQGVAGQSSSNDLRLRSIAVAASLCLHIFLLIVVSRDSGFEIESPVPPTLSINLVPANLLIEETVTEFEAAEEAASAIAELEEVLEEAEAAEDPAEQSVAEPAIVDVPEPVEPVAETVIVEDAPIAVPSVLVIQDSVRREQEQQARSTRSWASSCTELQQVAGTLGCEQTREPDYQAATISPQRQSVYEFHNPVVERSRSEETSPIIAAQTSALAASLVLNEIPAGLSEYLMAEVEAGISLYSNQGNLALQNMDIMVERSAAAQISREINSPWVQLASRQQQARRYLNRQERQQSEECQSALLLILAPAEIAECLGEGHYGVLLTPLNFSFDIDY